MCRDSPLPARWDRITQIGDASGMQSPLSFGGLAALLRHLPRLTDAMEDALLSDLLDRGCLAAMNQYQPALSSLLALPEVHVRFARDVTARWFHQQTDADQLWRDVLAR